MANEYDCCVVGAGAMGSATAYHLARAGKRVLLLEQFTIGHENGSSHGNSRIFRLCYDHPAYVQMAKVARPMWLELERQAEHKLFTATGGLDLGQRGNPVLEACIDSLSSEHVDFELLDAAEIRKRFPQFVVDDSFTGIYQRDAAVLDASECVKHMVLLALAHGAHLKEKSWVTSLEFRNDQVIVTTSDEVYKAATIVVSAGAWAGDLLAQTGIHVPLQVRKEQYLFFRTTRRDLFQPGRMPVFTEFGIGLDDDIGMYGFPILELNAVKVAAHQRGPTTTASTRTFEIESEGAAAVKEYAKKRFGDLLGKIVEAKTCLYTNTSDRHFILDIAPQQPNMVIASACSGHGFKFAILIGKIAADLAMFGRTEFPIEMFSIKRLVTT